MFLVNKLLVQTYIRENRFRSSKKAFKMPTTWDSYKFAYSDGILFIFLKMPELQNQFAVF